MLFVALVSLHCVNVCCRVRIFGNAWFIELTHVNNTVHHLMRVIDYYLLGAVHRHSKSPDNIQLKQ